jgi:outer membrane protein assembly factor BamB
MVKSKQPKSEFVRNDTAWRTAAGVAVVAGIFVLVVSTLLIANYLQVRAAEPLDNVELLRLREELAKAPSADEALVEQIRALDLLSRRAFFASQAHLRIGGQLLLAGAVVFLVALRLAARWNVKLPSPGEQADSDSYWTAIAQSKELISGTAIILVLMSLTAAYMTPSGVPIPEQAPVIAPGDIPEPGPSVAAVETHPTWEEMKQEWPCFRGPGGFGIAQHTTAPVQWDIASGQGIRWKVEAPKAGFNSPVIWGTRLFLSGATEEVREVYCFDTETGELLWRQALPTFPGTPETPPKVSEDTGYAAPTMAVHGERAFAIFGTGDLACFDLEGKLLWGRNIGVPDNHYGHSSSLIAFEDKLFVQYDEKTKPRVIALDVASGEEIWTTARKKISWASPACIPTSFGFQLVLASELDVDAYDLATGKLLWTENGLDGEVAPSPTFSGDTIFVANEYAMASAVRLSGSEGAVNSEIVWQWEDCLPEVASPTSSDKYFYIASAMGEIVCLDVKSGEMIWLEEFDQGFYSSPIRVGDRIYVADMEGTMFILGTGPEFEKIAAFPFAEPIVATPAFLDKRIYVRTEQHLICIESND